MVGTSLKNIRFIRWQMTTMMLSSFALLLTGLLGGVLGSMIIRTRQISQAVATTGGCNNNHTIEEICRNSNQVTLPQKQAHNNLHFNQDHVLNVTSRDTLPDNVRTRIDSLLQESRPTPQLQLQQTLPSHPNNPRKDQVEYDLIVFFTLNENVKLKGVPHL